MKECISGEGSERVGVLRPQCTFHLLAVGRRLDRTGRGKVGRHLICCCLLLRPGCCVVCLTLAKSNGLIKPTVRRAWAHKRDDESGEWSGLWWILALSCTGRSGGLRPAYWERGTLHEVETGTRHAWTQILQRCICMGNEEMASGWWMGKVVTSCQQKSKDLCLLKQCKVCVCAGPKAHNHSEPTSPVPFSETD